MLSRPLLASRPARGGRRFFVVLDPSSPEALAWLAGFLDAEGSYGVSRATKNHPHRTSVYYYPIISFSNSDQTTLQHIKTITLANNLNYVPVQIARQGTRNAHWRGTVHGFYRCTLWLNTLMPYIRTKRKRALALLQYCNQRTSRSRWETQQQSPGSQEKEWLALLNMPEPDQPAISKADTTWLAGFTDGEGHFTIARNAVRNGWIFIPRIAITNTHMPSLLYVKGILDSYQLAYSVLANGIRQEENAKPYWRINIQGLRRCHNWLSVFLQHLQTKSAQGKLLMEYCESRINMDWPSRGYSTRDKEIITLFNQNNTVFLKVNIAASSLR